jgi:hypothetical protein
VIQIRLVSLTRESGLMEMHRRVFRWMTFHLPTKDLLVSLLLLGFFGVSDCVLIRRIASGVPSQTASGLMGASNSDSTSGSLGVMNLDSSSGSGVPPTGASGSGASSVTTSGSIGATNTSSSSGSTGATNTASSSGSMGLDSPPEGFIGQRLPPRTRKAPNRLPATVVINMARAAKGGETWTFYPP